MDKLSLEHWRLKSFICVNECYTDCICWQSIKRTSEHLHQKNITHTTITDVHNGHKCKSAFEICSHSSVWQIIWNGKTKKELAFSVKLTKTRNRWENTEGFQLQETASTCVDLLIYFRKQDYPHTKSQEGLLIKNKPRYTLDDMWRNTSLTPPNTLK